MKTLGLDFDLADSALALIVGTVASALLIVGTTMFGLIMLLMAGEASAASGRLAAVPPSAAARTSDEIPGLDPTAIACGRQLAQTSGCKLPYVRFPQ